MEFKKTETKQSGVYEHYYLTGAYGKEHEVSEEIFRNYKYSVRNEEAQDKREHSVIRVQSDNNGGNCGYPRQKVFKGNGVSIEHYYPNDHGNPAHLHVKGGGLKTKIGPRGKPIKGQPQLSPKQASVVKENLTSIKKVIKQIQKNLRKSIKNN